MNLRKKIADSQWFNRAVEGLIAGYIRLSYRTSRWRERDCGGMTQAAKAGEPVIMVLWHQRLIMSPYLFDCRTAPICALTSGGRAGRLAGQIFTRWGFDTIPMSSHTRHVALSREVLRRYREGSSIGIAADGPRGPARQSSTVPIQWSRLTGARIFVVAFSANRVLSLPTWDQQMLPTPFSTGSLICREWNQTIPKRKLSEEETEDLRRTLTKQIDEITAEADILAGRPAPTA